VSRRTKQIWIIFALTAIVSFSAWPLYQYLYGRAVGRVTYERTRALVERKAELQADWTRALEDEVLTWDEAKAILEKGGEQADRNE